MGRKFFQVTSKYFATLLVCHFRDRQKSGESSQTLNNTIHDDNETKKNSLRQHQEV